MLRREIMRMANYTAPCHDSARVAPFQLLWAGLWTISQRNDFDEVFAGSVETARHLAHKSFKFLNHVHTFDTQVGWNDPALKQLWRYHLHYFGYVQDLLVAHAKDPSVQAYPTFRRLAEDWIVNNQRMIGDGWHPYTLSLRIVNWIQALRGFALELESDISFQKKLVASLYGQIQMLRSDLEHDVRGNHLFENIRALIFAGLSFEGKEPREWLKTGLALLQTELAEQVLSDGGHFERTPTYHFVVLRGCVELGLWLRRNIDLDLPRRFEWLEMAIHRMTDYGEKILPTNSRLPLLKDTALDATPEPIDVLTAAHTFLGNTHSQSLNRPGRLTILLFTHSELEQASKSYTALQKKTSGPIAYHLPDTGYFVLRNDEMGEHIIVDIGKVCPDYLPAHAHADALSYEYSINGAPVVVDSGVYEYEVGRWRNYFRSTRAHNTVEVGSLDQSEVWGSFRVARRAKVRLLQSEVNASFGLIQAEHDGYARLSPCVQHRRTWLWHSGSFLLIVDQLFGKGKTRADNWLHLHPRINVCQNSEPKSHLFNLSSAGICIQTFGDLDTQYMSGLTQPYLQGWYSESFGILHPATALRMRVPSQLPSLSGYAITSDATFSLTYQLETDEAVILATNQNGKYKLIFATDQICILEAQ
jgi:uncharacterized heparinase superfamily protein